MGFFLLYPHGWHCLLLVLWTAEPTFTGESNMHAAGYVTFLTGAAQICLILFSVLWVLVYWWHIGVNSSAAVEVSGNQ